MDMKEFVKDVGSGLLLLIPIGLLFLLIISTVYNFGNETIQRGIFVTSLLCMAWILGHFKRNKIVFARKKDQE